MTGIMPIAGSWITPSCGDPTWNPKLPPKSQEEFDRSEDSKKIKVIIVDDEALIAETLVEILNSAGFDTQSVSSGLEAIELSRTWLPDVVLSDVIMPGLNGVETGIRIRDRVPKCTVILFSGQAATVDLLEEARRKGHTFQILAKPVKPEQLISIIQAGRDSPS